MGWIYERNRIMRGGVHSLKGSITYVVYRRPYSDSTPIVAALTSRAPEKGERPALAGN